MIRLGINIDHVATLRNARGGEHPCPVRAALIAMEAGADGITAHLREDRRHIRDHDMERLKNEVPLPLNMEMAATDEMLAIALRIRPHAVCIVPEKREEITTEGGLNASALKKELLPLVAKLQDAGIRVSLFIGPEKKQIDAAITTGAKAIELHTGHYAMLFASPKLPHSDKVLHDDMNKEVLPPTLTLPLKAGGDVSLMLKQELAGLYFSTDYAHQAGLEVHAGHGLNYENVAPVAGLPYLRELNIGHFLMGEAMFIGMHEAVQKMKHAILSAAKDTHENPSTPPSYGAARQDKGAS